MARARSAKTYSSAVPRSRGGPDPMSKTVRLLVCVCAVFLGGAVLAGCGSSNKSSSSSSSSGTSTTSSGAASLTTDKKIAASVPAAIKKKGTLVVATDATYAPNEFIAPDGHTIEGMDADLAAALGKVMGLKLQLKNASFDGIVPGLAAHKYDL